MEGESYHYLQPKKQSLQNATAEVERHFAIIQFKITRSGRLQKKYTKLPVFFFDFPFRQSCNSL